jgi:uncharacterized protein DUF3761
MNRLAWALFVMIAAVCLVGAQVAAASPTHGSAGHVPHDATARCHDGTWSSAQERNGACSSHGGVKTWFGKPPKEATARCKDGSYSKSASSQGACSSHGGVAYPLEHVKGKK